MSTTPPHFGCVSVQGLYPSKPAFEGQLPHCAARRPVPIHKNLKDATNAASLRGFLKAAEMAPSTGKETRKKLLRFYRRVFTHLNILRNGLEGKPMASLTP